ncbi:MAG: PLDc N-terminal domain-containing protein [Mesonia sp.]|uniref:PLDc N-terminal domain-containing protein n=1 Tax=Mesonia sp. TaxID=1960830 RepID=UPI003241F9DE
MILIDANTRTGLLILYAAMTINAIYLALKYEKQHMKVIWSLLAIFLPLLGSALYLIQFQINKKELRGIKN